MPSYWDTTHDKYAKQDWIDKPSLFAEWAAPYFPKSGELVDLGGGQGQDSMYFAKLGYDVTLIDMSENALAYAKKRLQRNLEDNITILNQSIEPPLPFDDGSIDIAFANLSLHYFTAEMTQKVFNDIFRILKPGGILAALFNSIEDPDCKVGKLIEPDFYEVDGITKRFFSVETLKPFVAKFTTLVIDNSGESYKDNATGIHHLIRFVGKK